MYGWNPEFSCVLQLPRCTRRTEPYATPRWVEKAGAGGYHLSGEGKISPDGPLWEPDIDDPVFLQKLDNFLAAAAARYDGNHSGRPRPK